MQLEYGVSTSTGRVRKRNEDSYACNPDIGLFIVAVIEVEPTTPQKLKHAEALHAE